MLDLGDLNGSVLVFGGPYGNLQATQALLAEAGRRGILPARIICTGDLVAYCAEPVATVDLVRRAGVNIVRGNCEENLGDDLSHCGCGFATGSDCDLLSGRWFAHARAALDHQTKTWMANLPRRILFGLAGRRFAVLHGGADDIARFIFASTPTDIKRTQFDILAKEGIYVDAIVAGHAGLPFTDNVDERLWLNAGVIGMPANDGTSRGWYSILTPEPEGLKVEICPLVYDHNVAAQRMAAEEMPEAYQMALSSGLWPSMDVLPPVERAWRGVELARLVMRPWASSRGAIGVSAP